MEEIQKYDSISANPEKKPNTTDTIFKTCA